MDEQSPLVQRALRLSLFEAICFSLMVGSTEVYFLANAVRLGATVFEQALAGTIPLCVGALGPWFSLMAVNRWRRRKAVVIVGASLQVMTLLLLVTFDLVGILTPWMLIALLSLYQSGGQAAGTAWSSWYGDIVPKAIRGRYFASRNRLVHLGASGALIVSGLLLEAIEPGAAKSGGMGASGFGYAIIFSIGLIFRSISIILFTLSPEFSISEATSPSAAIDSSTRTAALPLNRLIGTAALLQFAVYLASPYFGPYMLDELRLSYTAYMVSSVSVVLLKWASLPTWGRAIDRYGARNVFMLATFFAALVPLPWVWAYNLPLVILAQALSGACWGGQEVSQFSLVLESVESPQRLRVFAALNILTSASQMLGSLIGGVFFKILHRHYGALFLVSTAARLSVALAAPRFLPHQFSAPNISQGTLFWRMLGIHAGSGVDNPPMTVDDSNKKRCTAGRKE